MYPFVRHGGHPSEDCAWKHKYWLRSWKNTYL